MFRNFSPKIQSVIRGVLKYLGYGSGASCFPVKDGRNLSRNQNKKFHTTEYFNNYTVDCFPYNIVQVLFYRYLKRS